MEHTDPRLERIRQYKGTIQDLTEFIKAKELETKQAQQDTNKKEQ